MGDIDDCPFAHAVDQHVGFAIQQNRTPDFVAPIIVMGQTPQARLDAAGDDGHSLVGFTTAARFGSRPMSLWDRDED